MCNFVLKLALNRQYRLNIIHKKGDVYDNHFKTFKNNVHFEIYVYTNIKVIKISKCIIKISNTRTFNPYSNACYGRFISCEVKDHGNHNTSYKLVICLSLKFDAILRGYQSSR